MFVLTRCGEVLRVCAVQPRHESRAFSSRYSAIRTCWGQGVWCRGVGCEVWMVFVVCMKLSGVSIDILYFVCKRDWNPRIQHMSMYVNPLVIKWPPFPATCGANRYYEPHARA